MHNQKHQFCRKSLAATMIVVRNSIPKDEAAEAWAWKNSAGYEFHGPRDRQTGRAFYRFYGRKVCCKWAAAFQGWTDYLDHYDLWDTTTNEVNQSAGTFHE